MRFDCSASTKTACLWLSQLASLLGGTAMAEQQAATTLGFNAATPRIECKLTLQSKSSTQLLTLALIGAADKQRVVAVPHPNKGTADSSTQVELLAGQRLEFLGAVDLAGNATAIALTAAACADHEAVVKLDGMKQPALLIKVLNQSTSASVSLVLLTAESKPRVIWTQTLSSQAANGAGYQTVDMRLEANPGNALDIVLLQHELPARNDRDYMPGPPLLLRFRANNGSYEQQRGHSK